MNLDKYNSKESLETLVKNEDEFFSVVNESNGFILEMLKNHKITPDLDLLVKNINVFTVPYVVENYKLTTEQSQDISDFLSEESSARIKKSLSKEEVKKYLTEGIPLPKTVLLSVDDINSFQKEIDNQFKMDNYEMNEILSNSFRKFNMEDVFNINKKFLLKNPNFLANKKAFFNDEKYRDFYKEIALKAYKDVGLSEFKNYIFGPEDKEFLFTLIGNENSNRFSHKQYANYSSISGFTELITKHEYFEKFNKTDLSMFSNGEIENNLDFFRKVFLNENEKQIYDVFDKLIRKKITVRQFKAIVDQEFVEKYLDSLISQDRIVHRFFGNLDAEYDRTVIDKKAHISKLVSIIFAEDKTLESGLKLREMSDLYSVFSIIKELKQEKYHPENKEDTEKDIREVENNLKISLTEVLPRSLKNENFSELAKNSNYIFNSNTIELADQFFEQNVNLNNFFLLIDLYVDAKKDRSSDRGYVNLIDKLAQYSNDMHEEFVKRNNHNEIVGVNTILKYYSDTKDEFIKGLLKNTPKRQGYSKSDEYNFLAYDVNDLKTLPVDLWSTVYSIRPDFGNYIIKNKIVAPNEFISRCLNSSGKSDSATNFLKSYVKINRGSIEKDEELLASFLSNPKQNEIFPLSSTAHLDGFYNEVITLILRKGIAYKKKKQVEGLYPKEDFPYSRDAKYPEIDINAFDENIEINSGLSKYEAKLQYLNLYEKHSLLSKELTSKAELIPYGFMTDKIKQIIEKKDFEMLSLIREDRIKYNNEPFVEYVNNSSFEDLIGNLKNKYFVKILKEQLNYDNETDIKFPKFTKEQNMELATSLWSIYKGFKEDKSEEVSYYDYKFLHFFSLENRGFIKEFAIKELPQFVFYGYDFLPESAGTYKPSKFIQGTYTNEEIYQAFVNLEEKGGFFSYKDVNADFKHFFTNVFFPEKRNHKEKPDDSRMKDFLTFIKDKNEILYAALANSNIFVNIIDFGRSYGDKKPPKYKTRDEGVNNYFHELFDLDVVVRGLEKIVEKMSEKNLDENNQKIVNKKVASYCITAVIHNTYFEDYDDNGRTKEYMSVTSKEHTLKLMKFLFEKAPMHFVERHIIGQSIEAVAFFKDNIKEFYSFENVKNFILPNSDVSTEYLRMDGESNEQKARLIGFTKAIIEHAVEQKDSQVIDFLNHTIKQHEFIEKEMSWSHRHRVYPGVSSMFVEAIAQDKGVRGMLQNSKLKIDLDSSLVVKEPVKKRNNKI